MTVKIIELMLKYISKYCTKNKSAIIQRSEKIDKKGTVIYKLRFVDCCEGEKYNEK